MITGWPKVHAEQHGGLLDVILHPEFKKNRWIYLSYSIQKRNKQSTALARGKLKGNKIKKLNSHLGKLLRLNEKGKHALGNPFTNTKEAKPEIWSFGHRNPQGLFIHPETKQIYLNEHGPKGRDEINFIKKGKNYGWPVITYGRTYGRGGLQIGEGTHKEGMEQPIKYWILSIAPCGLLIYSGKKFPKWKGDFFSGALALTHLNKIKIKDKKASDEKRFLSPLNFRFCHVIEGPEGFIYALTSTQFSASNE